MKIEERIVSPDTMRRWMDADPVSISAITSEMVTAGEDVVLRAIGGADCGGHFSASDLAVAVFLAMREVE